MFEKTQALLDDLAQILGVAPSPLDESRRVQLSVGEDSTVLLFAEDEFTLLLVSAVGELPKTLDYGTGLWLLRRNFYDSPIAPFRVSCDSNGTMVLWGRVPVEAMTGASLAKLIDGLAVEADVIRGEVAVDDGTDDDEPDETP